MRNVFVHEYFGVDPNLVWEIIKSDLPGLKEGDRREARGKNG